MGWKQAYEARTDLAQYSDNALGVFAIGLRFDTDDLASLAATSVTDGSDDKKTDIVHVDCDSGIAVVAQCYWSTKKKTSAPANKASDLNAAMSWLIRRNLAELPVRIKSAAQELRRAILDGDISEIHVWYVHNLDESENVKTELKTVEGSAQLFVGELAANSEIRIRAMEVGNNRLTTWYEATQTPILVDDEIEFSCPDGMEVSGDGWTAFSTHIPASELHELYRKYETELFSANIRDYLGSRQSGANINNGIRKSAQDSPRDFWVFNNGVTALVNDYRFASGKLTTSGVSIVNGAQTTGALGTLSSAPSPEARVPIRFVKTNNDETVRDIIRFNNSQNKVTASDFRSADNVQKRLREEVATIPDCEYEGGRRGGRSAVIKRRPNLMPSYTVGQALAAVHVDPVVAYNKKSQIWDNDATYSKLFHDETRAEHVVFAFSLLRAVEDRKSTLVAKSPNESDLTEVEQRELEFFRHRGSNYLLVSAVASSLETLLGANVPDRFRLSFGKKSPAQAQNNWAPVVAALVTFASKLEPAVRGGFRADRTKEAIQTFQELVQATAEHNSRLYSNFAKSIIQLG